MEYLTVAEVVERTGVAAATIRAMARDQLIEAYESSGRWIFPEQAVEALEEQIEAAQAALESGEHEPSEEEEEDEDHLESDDGESDDDEGDDDESDDEIEDE